MSDRMWIKAVMAMTQTSSSGFWRTVNWRRGQLEKRKSGKVGEETKVRGQSGMETTLLLMDGKGEVIQLPSVFMRHQKSA